MGKKEKARIIYFQFYLKKSCAQSDKDLRSAVLHRHKSQTWVDHTCLIATLI